MNLEEKARHGHKSDGHTESCGADTEHDRCTKRPAE